MTDMSEEAKQAAGKWLMEGNTNVTAGPAFAAGYNAATAKLQEQIATLRELRDVEAKEIAKLQEAMPERDVLGWEQGYKCGKAEVGMELAKAWKSNGELLLTIAKLREELEQLRQ